MKLYIARDKGGYLYIFVGKPIRMESTGVFCANNTFMFTQLPREEFREITWENSPVEADLKVDFPKIEKDKHYEAILEDGQHARVDVYHKSTKTFKYHVVHSGAPENADYNGYWFYEHRKKGIYDTGGYISISNNKVIAADGCSELPEAIVQLLKENGIDSNGW